MNQQEVSSSIQKGERPSTRYFEMFLHTNKNINLVRGVHIATPKRPQPSHLLLNGPHSSSPPPALLREPAFDRTVIKYSKRNNLKHLLLAGDGCRHFQKLIVDEDTT